MNRRPARHNRPQSPHRSAPDRGGVRQPIPLVQRRSFAYRHRQQRRRRIIALIVGAAILGLLLAILLWPKGEQDIPVVNPEISSEIISSEITSEVISSDPIDPEWERAYQAAAQVRLINFDHPNYDEPTKLVALDTLLSDTVTVNSGANYLEEEAALALKEMFDAADAAGITTYIVNSAYRDRATQQSFWDNRLAQNPEYGDDVYANPVKTVPAYASEHCTGLAVDILCDSVPHGTSDYQDTAEAKWLAENAHKYGFILRYPDGKSSVTGVIYEAWHYRYVGKEAAADIYQSGLCLEEYLASFGLPEANPAPASQKIKST